MPTNVLTVGTTAATSADTVVAAGSQLTVAIKDAAGPLVATDAVVDILLKDDAGQYFKFGTLSYFIPALVLSAGTYQFSRPAGPSCGVFSA